MIKKQRGSSLVEVMVGLFILATGLLGMASLQNLALRENNTAYLYSQAMYLAQDGIDRIRSNRSEVNAYRTLYSEQPNTLLDCQANACSAAQLAQWDLSLWKLRVADRLPKGKAEITVSDAAEVTVAIEFDDSRGAKIAINISLSSAI